MKKTTTYIVLPPTLRILVHLLNEGMPSRDPLLLRRVQALPRAKSDQTSSDFVFSSYILRSTQKDRPSDVRSCDDGAELEGYERGIVPD